MKKLLLPLIFAPSASALQAQNNEMYSLLFRSQGEYEYCIMGLMQQRDGDIIINTYLIADTGNYNYISLGYMAYKVDPASLAVTDSLFIADTAMSPPCSFVQNPFGEGNIRTSVEYREDCDSSFLHISLFPDNDFSINPDEDVVAPLCEGLVSSFLSFIDCRGDLILQYAKERDAMHSDEYAARFGLDGTLKCQALLHEEFTWGPSRLQVLKESPLTYYQWGQAGESLPNSLVIYEIDSLFHINPIFINNLLSEEVVDTTYFTVREYLETDSETEVIPVGGNDILVAAQYWNDTAGYHLTAERGVAVAKYDIRTMRLKGYTVFNDYPGFNHQAQCMGFKKMTDGSVYFLYKENGYPAEIIVAVKMDTDMNVEWKRFFKTDNMHLYTFYGRSILYNDEQGEEKGVAWLTGGTHTETNNFGWVLFFLNHDGPVNVMEKSGIVMRPYTFYPNPAKNQLYMEFSPDVQPAQVELYDLQGRLVRTQNKDFGSIELGQLPAGTYTMRVTFEDGQVYSDKVVKE